MKVPANAAKHPISELIEKLQSLPLGTTFEYVEDHQALYGAEVPQMDLGTTYQFAVLAVEGFNPPREWK